jgi:hypothetical protein
MDSVSTKLHSDDIIEYEIIKNQSQSIAEIISSYSTEEIEHFIKPIITKFSSIVPTIDLCQKWKKNYERDPNTLESIIYGSINWHYWAFYTKKIINFNINFCNGKTGKPLIWSQDGLKLYGDVVKYCEICDKNSQFLYIKHHTHGDIKCVLCKRKASLIFCCMFCKNTPNHNKIKNSDRIEKILNSYHNTLWKQRIGKKYINRR